MPIPAGVNLSPEFDLSLAASQGLIDKGFVDVIIAVGDGPGRSSDHDG